MSGDSHDPSNKIRRFHYKIIARGEAAPVSPDELPKSLSMNRKLETLNLDYTDSGKLIYMAVQFENGDRAGPWGPMISAIIP